MSKNSDDSEKTKSGLCTAGLVCGIIGICTSFIPLINNIAFVLGLLAVIFGLLSIKKAGKAKLIATIILGILAIVITIQSQQNLSDAIDEALDDLDNSLSDMSGENTDKILSDYADVSFGEFQVEYGEYSNDTKLVVTVTNKSDEKQSFSFHIEAVASDNSRIDEDYVYATDLGAGQSQSFEIFTYVSDSNLEAMQNATFNIIEASMY